MRRVMALASLWVVLCGVAWAGQGPSTVPVLPSRVLKPGQYVLRTTQVPDWATQVRLVIDRSQMHDPAGILTFRVEYSGPGETPWVDLVSGVTQGGLLSEEDGTPILVSRITSPLPDPPTEGRRVRGRLLVQGIGQQLAAEFEFLE